MDLAAALEYYDSSKAKKSVWNFFAFFYFRGSHETYTARNGKASFELRGLCG